MACEACSINSKDGKPRGCQSNGGCSTGGCNKLNTFDWLSTSDVEDPTGSPLVEVSFRNGAFKQFFRLAHPLQAETRDLVVVDAVGGYDIGEVTLKGDLVLLQMKKKKIKQDAIFNNVVRIANEHDLEKLNYVIGKEKTVLVRSRAIARTLGLEMKIGEVVFRADNKKATFFYTAEGRVDFRELIRHYAKEFRIKVEMKQIGSRQESALIGGLGSCGRELCCSTWLTHFNSVTTSAARYQNLAINQAKLSGQCGRLKCCLNYELDIYIEALEAFPSKAESLAYSNGTARLLKTDIFKKLMYYLVKDERGRDNLIALSVDQVITLQADILQGNIPAKITGIKVEQFDTEELQDEELTGHMELKPEPARNRKNRGNRQDNRNNNRPENRSNNRPQGNRPQRDKNRNDHSSQDQSNRENPQRKQTSGENETNSRPSRDRRIDNRNRPSNNQGQNQRPDRPFNKQQNSGENNNPENDRSPQEPRSNQGEHRSRPHRKPNFRNKGRQGNNSQNQNSPEKED